MREVIFGLSLGYKEQPRSELTVQDRGGAVLAYVREADVKVCVGVGGVIAGT